MKNNKSTGKTTGTTSKNPYQKETPKFKRVVATYPNENNHFTLIDNYDNLQYHYQDIDHLYLALQTFYQDMGEKPPNLETQTKY